MQGVTGKAEKGNAEDSKFGLNESLGSVATGYGRLPSPSALAFSSIILAANSVSAALKLPKQGNWEYATFCITNMLSFCSSLSIILVRLLGQLNPDFLVASVKASCRIMIATLMSMSMSYFTIACNWMEDWKAYYIWTMVATTGVIGIFLIAFTFTTRFAKLA